MQTQKELPTEENEEEQSYKKPAPEKPSYYYDDAHGYEDYDPENEDDEEFED